MPVMLVNLVLVSGLISLAVRVLGLEGVICCLRVLMKEIFNLLKCCKGSTFDYPHRRDRMEDDSRWKPHSQSVSFHLRALWAGQGRGYTCPWAFLFASTVGMISFTRDHPQCSNQNLWQNK